MRIENWEKCVLWDLYSGKNVSCNKLLIIISISSEDCKT